MVVYQLLSGRYKLVCVNKANKFVGFSLYFDTITEVDDFYFSFPEGIINTCYQVNDNIRHRHAVTFLTNMRNKQHGNRKKYNW